MATLYAFTRAARLADNARAFRRLARGFRQCAAEGLCSADNMRAARHCERSARQCEAELREYADSLIASAIVN